jgi:signal transduction histidine kinase
MTTRADAGEMTALGRKTPAAEMPRGAVFVRFGVAAVAVLALSILLVTNPPSAHRLPYFALYGAAIIVAETFFLVRIAPGSYFSISPTFLFVYFLISGATAAAALAGVAHGVVWFIQRLRGATSQTPMFALFNAGQHILAVLAAGLFVQWTVGGTALVRPVITSPIPAIVIFALGYLLVSTLVNSLAVYARGGFGEVLTHLWPTTTLWTAISTGVCIPFAIVIRLVAPALGGYTAATFFTFVFLVGISLVARLNVSLRNGNNDLKAINTIGTLITATLDLPEIFAIIARESRRVLRWDGFFIALGGPHADEIEMVFLSQTGAEVARRRIPRGAGLTGKAILNGELVSYEQDEQGRNAIETDDTFRGRRRPKSLVIAPMKFGDEVIGAICVQSYQSDVYGGSQFRVLQTIAGQAAIAVRNAQLFESEKRAKDERDEFLSLVTHEIKNPLTSIRGYATLAEQSARTADLEATLEAMRVIEGESAKILRLTEDLLDASRMTAGLFAVQASKADLAEIVRHVTRKYEATSKHRFELSIPEGFPEIAGDPTRLSQVVENLVSNAVKYSPEDRTVRLELRTDGSRVALAVRDEGPGIPPDRLPLVFERFYRIEEEGRTVKGTGLGLFISREIVRMHGGELFAESTPGRGSVFTMTLPVRNRER